jgi:hypothetical protein
MTATGWTSCLVTVAITAAALVVALSSRLSRRLHGSDARRIEWFLALAAADPSGIGQLGASGMLSTRPRVVSTRRARTAELPVPCPN